MGTWYRGESTGARLAAHGGFVHDLGDGMYFTDDLHVAYVYANKRVKEAGGQGQVLRIELGNSQLGRVLDLRADPRWASFVKPIESHIRASNENYGRSFQDFLKFHKIDLNQYDAVIGKEYLNGGIQLCILNRNGQTSQLARMVRGSMEPLSGTVEFQLRPMQIDKASLGRWWQGRNGGTQSPQGTAVKEFNEYTRQFYGQQRSMENGAALFGQLLAGVIHRGNCWAVRAVARDQLAEKYQPQIANYFAQGKGVLVVMLIQEPLMEDVNGYRSQVLRSLILMPGVSPEASLRDWKSSNSMTVGPDRNCRLVEDYLWLDPK